MSAALRREVSPPPRSRINDGLLVVGVEYIAVEEEEGPACCTCPRVGGGERSNGSAFVRRLDLDPVRTTYPPPSHGVVGPAPGIEGKADKDFRGETERLAVVFVWWGFSGDAVRSRT